MQHLLVLLIVLTLFPANEPETLLLWPNGAPDAVGTAEEDVPTLTVYLAPEDKATGTAVVIFPGGGYGHLAMDHEGHQVAAWLNELGVSAFIVKYRHAPGYQHPTPLRDAQRAIRTVRSRAGEWGIDAERIGVLGFSAGGHLAATAGTQFEWEDPLEEEKWSEISARPDFLVLAYPVISMSEPYMHRGSRNNLLGKDASEQEAVAMSHEKNVTSDTPPTFLFHTTSDAAVPPENSIYLYVALKEAGVPVEMHIYEEGRHGVGLAQDNPALASWPGMCEAWMRARGLLDRR